MRSKTPEQQHLDKVAQLGCVVCRNMKFGKSPAECHHIRDGQGSGQRASDYETIPLCSPHHRTGGPGIAFHATGREEWERMYGMERKLLNQVRQELALLEMRSNIFHKQEFTTTGYTALPMRGALKHWD